MRRPFCNPTLWQYAEDTPTEILLRHQRRASQLTRLWAWSLVGMGSSVFEFLVHRSTIPMYLCIAFGVLCLLVSIPAILSQLLVHDIDRILEQREHRAPIGDALGLHVGISAMKTIFWFAVCVALIESLSRLK